VQSDGVLRLLGSLQRQDFKESIIKHIAGGHLKTINNLYSQQQQSLHIPAARVLSTCSNNNTKCLHYSSTCLHAVTIIPSVCTTAVHVYMQ